MLAPTIREVAEAAAVSLGTVSRVVNGHENVAAPIRERVERAIAALGYVPNPAARSMRGRVTRTVGCIVHDLAIPGFAAVVRAAQDRLLEAGYALLVTSSAGEAAREEALLDLLAQRRTDALLLAPYASDGFARVAAEAEIPVVLLDREPAGSADAVLIDHEDGTRQAAEVLLALGHRRIALLTGPAHLYPAQARQRGFAAAHAAFGCNPIRGGVVTDILGTAAAARATRRLLSRAARPTALIAGGIQLLPDMIRAIRQQGLTVPGDISLVGAMRSDLADLHDPAIAVVDWDYAEAGRLAAGLLLNRLAGGRDAPRRLLVPTRLRPAASIGAPRV